MKNIKVLSISLLLLLLWLLIFTVDANANQPTITGEAAILMDAHTGQILYQKNIHQQMHPASTTKMLTALIALQEGELDELVTVGAGTNTIEGSTLWLQQGEQLTLEDLLYALMLKSANDAAVVIAQHLAGSVDNFCQLMNAAARQWGAKSSNFVNPHGLTDEAHYTTAYDLAMIARQAVQNKKLVEISSTENKTIDRGNPDDFKFLINHNRLLWKYDGAIGIKTGYTSAAQQCLVAAARRDNRELITVVLKSQGQDIWQDTTALLDYGFNNFKLIKLLSKGELLGETVAKHSKQSIPLIANEDIYYSCAVNHQPNITRKVNLDSPVAPVSRGAVLGRLELYDGQQKLDTINVLSNTDVKRSLLTHWWFWANILAAGLLTGWIFNKRAVNKRKKCSIRSIRHRNIR